jgi:hypothetical protein
MWLIVHLVNLLRLQEAVLHLDVIILSHLLSVKGTKPEVALGYL